MRDEEIEADPYDRGAVEDGMNILFLMDRRVNAGSIQAVGNYQRAAIRLGHTVALYGLNDSKYPNIRFSTDVENFDYVLFIVESGLGWMSGLRMPRILSAVPRSRRAILDADGMYNSVIALDGYDHNHTNEQQRTRWLRHYELIADKILQPTFCPRDPRVKSLPFYGYDPGSRITPPTTSQKAYDVVHLGHNWWRWREIDGSLLPAIERIRDLIGEICFIGCWWDGAPPTPCDPDLELAFSADNQRLRQLRIQVKPPVPYTDVITAMSMARVNIMTQRPLLRSLGFLTSKYFEVFTADTIPLIMLEPDHAESVYGPAGRQLTLNGSIAEKLLDALSYPEKYRDIVRDVRSHLAEHHSYESRVRALVEALET